MTELPNEYARRVVALRLLSALGHVREDPHRLDRALDEAMDDPNLRDAVAYLVGLGMERYCINSHGDWAEATAEIDAQLKLAEDLESLGSTDEPEPPA